MSAGPTPRYPVYVPSKRRSAECTTPAFLIRDEVSFHLVVEPQEKGIYAAKYGEQRILMLPADDQGLIYSRNWIKEHATAAGFERHWQLDDNLRETFRLYRGNRLPCNSGVALRAVEDFVDRYQNVALAGLNYTMFAVGKPPPFYVNQRVYSCSLILNAIPQRWRARYNDDTDLCLQVLAAGWCTVLFNAFLVEKKTTMTMKGGNTDALYQGDGRLRMAKSLERLWPGVVETKRRFKRPQHVVKDAWKRFDTPLKLKPGVDLAAIPPNDYGLKLVAVKEVKSERLKRLLAEDQSAQAEQSQR